MIHKTLQPIAYLILVVLLTAWSKPFEDTIGAGLQPQSSLDNSGNIRIAYGRADSIFCSTSSNAGVSFSKPVFIGKIKGMHLGMTRGPQIASSADYSVITAIDQTGNIHFFRLRHAANKWEYKGVINDIPHSAPEGLMSIASDTKDNFYAVWLDIRQDKKNNICFSSLSGKTGKWNKNNLIYISPDGHVCECCKPSIDVKGAKVAVMYRNWLQGSRDLYLMTSDNMGISFNSAKKLGLGTWKLNGCPMDGGSVNIDAAGMIHTVWQRAGNIYYCRPNESEIMVSKGRGCSITADKTSNKYPLISLQDGGSVKLASLQNQSEIIVGSGGYLKSIRLDNEQILCFWEQDKTVRYKKVSIPAACTAFAK